MAKQVIADDEEQNQEQYGEQRASKKKGKQHAHPNPEKNKSEHFFHGGSSDDWNYYRICGLFFIRSRFF